MIILSIISGYADPEYVATGNISKKADVYGFGIVLFEIISGRLIRSYMKAEGTRKLPPPDYVRICFLIKKGMSTILS
jgi:serine/threonine protein kinase